MSKAQSGLKKIKYRLSKVFGRFHIETDNLILKTLLLLIIFTLSYNVINTYKKGALNTRLIKEEEEKLERLIDESNKLDNLERYYSSVEYKRIYARESQNLVEEGERLYYVNRPEEIEVESLIDDSDPILLNENSKWWLKLILGK